MNKMIVKNFIEEESGQDLIEYALVAALIGLASVATLKTVATAVSGLYTSIVTSLNAAG